MSGKAKTNILVLIVLVAGTTNLILNGGPVLAIVPFLLPLFIGGVIIAWVILRSIGSKTAKIPDRPLTVTEKRRFNITRILIIVGVLTFLIVSSLI